MIRKFIQKALPLSSVYSMAGGKTICCICCLKEISNLHFSVTKGTRNWDESESSDVSHRTEARPVINGLSFLSRTYTCPQLARREGNTKSLPLTANQSTSASNLRITCDPKSQQLSLCQIECVVDVNLGLTQILLEQGLRNQRFRVLVLQVRFCTSDLFTEIFGISVRLDVVISQGDPRRSHSLPYNPLPVRIEKVKKSTFIIFLRKVPFSGSCTLVITLVNSFTS